VHVTTSSANHLTAILNQTTNKYIVWFTGHSLLRLIQTINNSSRQLTFPVSGSRQPASRELCWRLGECYRVRPRRYPLTGDTTSRQSSVCHSEHVSRLAAEDIVLCWGRLDQDRSHVTPATSGVLPVPASTSLNTDGWCSHSNNYNSNNNNNTDIYNACNLIKQAESEVLVVARRGGKIKYQRSPHCYGISHAI